MIRMSRTLTGYGLRSWKSLAIGRLRHVTFLLVILLATSAMANATSNIVLKKKVIDKKYDMTKIKRVAIYPMTPFPDPKSNSKYGLSKKQRVDMPHDSVLVQFSAEIANHIRHQDSTVETLILTRPESLVTNDEFISAARQTARADAVVIMRVSELQSEKAKPMTHIGTAVVEGRAASTTARITFSMHDSQDGREIWRVELVGSDWRGDPTGWDTKEQPPPREGVLLDLTITAASWLPF